MSEKGYNEIYAEATSLYRKYRGMGSSRREAHHKIREKMETKYKDDRRILEILKIVLMVLMLFI
jgi:hypothetical protein